jgi:hypothetical protein
MFVAYNIFQIFSHSKQIWFFNLKFKYTGCLKIREFRIQRVVRITSVVQIWKLKKNRHSPHKDTLKVHSLNCFFFKYRLKSSVLILIYGADECGK